MDLRRRHESEFIADLGSLVPHFESSVVALNEAITPILYSDWKSVLTAIASV